MSVRSRLSPAGTFSIPSFLTHPCLYVGIVVAAASGLTGCRGKAPSSPSGPAPKAGGPAQTAKAPAPPPAVNLAVDKPNELGLVPILEYHHIAPKEDRWARTPANFRKDLERLYKEGYRPVALMDYVHGKIDVPPGKSPVILTFDDSDPGQFRYLGHGPAAKLDPDCAVAMILDFNKKHHDFPAKATFYVLPSLFGQPEFEARKLKELQQWGFEIGDHTFTHPSLRTVSRQQGLEELAKGVGVTRKYLPGYDVQSIALPNGSVPHDDSILHGGSFGGVTYRHEAALLVGAEPAPSPFSKKFKPFRLPRIQSTDTVKPSLTDWLNNLQKHAKSRFRSDGDPNTVTFPKEDSDRLNPAAAKGKKVRAYGA